MGFIKKIQQLKIEVSRLRVEKQLLEYSLQDRKDLESYLRHQLKQILNDLKESQNKEKVLEKRVNKLEGLSFSDAVLGMTILDVKKPISQIDHIKVM